MEPGACIWCNNSIKKYPEQIKEISFPCSYNGHAERNRHEGDVVRRSSNGNNSITVYGFSLDCGNTLYVFDFPKGEAKGVKKSMISFLEMSSPYSGVDLHAGKAVIVMNATTLRPTIASAKLGLALLIIRISIIQ